MGCPCPYFCPNGCFCSFLYLVHILFVTLSIAPIKIEYKNIEFENGEIKKQSGELKATWGAKSNLGN